MDWMTFTAELFKAIVEILKAAAWPAVFLYVFIRSREPILALLKKLTHVEKAEGFGVKLDFQRRIREVSQQTSELPQIHAEQLGMNSEREAPPNVRAITQSITLSSGHRDLYELRLMMSSGADQEGDRGDVIRLAWDIVQETIKRTLAAKDVSYNLLSPSHGDAMLRALSEHKLLPFEYIQVIVSLKALRDSLSHNTTVKLTKASIYEYVKSAEKMIDALEAVSNQSIFRVNDRSES